MSKTDFFIAIWILSWLFLIAYAQFLLDLYFMMHVLIFLMGFTDAAGAPNRFT